MNVRKNVEHTSILCLSCVAQQSNVMSIEPNCEARTLEHGTSLGATNGYDTIVRHVVFVHVSSGRNDHKRHRHSKETMEIFVPHVNKLAQHLPVRKLTEYLRSP